MTEKEETRRDALVALRRRDRAEALIQLRDALDQSEKIAADEKANRSRIEALKQRLDAACSTKKMNAGRLASHIDHMRLTKTALRKHRQTEATLAQASLEISARIDAAKEKVTKSQKALRALEERDSSIHGDQSRQPR